MDPKFDNRWLDAPLLDTPLLGTSNGVGLGDLVVIINSQSEPLTVMSLYPGGLADCQGRNSSCKLHTNVLMTLAGGDETLACSFNRQCTGVESYVQKASNALDKLEVQRKEFLDALERQRKEYVKAIEMQHREWQHRLVAAKKVLFVLEESVRIIGTSAAFAKNRANLGNISFADAQAKYAKAKKDVDKISEILGAIKVRLTKANKVIEFSC